MVYIIFICFMIVLCSANGKEEPENEEEYFQVFCEDFNLGVHVHGDSKKCTLAVYFEVENSSHAGCFDFFDVSLIREKEEVAIFRVKYDDINAHAYHKFQNVNSGMYELVITPHCSIRKCPSFKIHHGSLINMTSNICISNGSEAYRNYVISEIPTTSVTSKIHPISLTKEAYTSSPSLYEVYTSPPNDTKTLLMDITYERKYQNRIKEKTVSIIQVSFLLLVIYIFLYLATRVKIRAESEHNPSITSL